MLSEQTAAMPQTVIENLAEALEMIENESKIAWDAVNGLADRLMRPQEPQELTTESPILEVIPLLPEIEQRIRAVGGRLRQTVDVIHYMQRELR